MIRKHEMAPMWDFTQPMPEPVSYTVKPEKAIPNGRIIALDEANSNKFQKMEDKRTDYTKTHILQGTLIRTPLSDSFFSKENMQRLQDEIRYNVYKKSNHLIGEQSNTELTIVMRAMFLQYAKHIQTDLIKQIEELNKYVVRFTVPKIVNEVEQWLYYRKDIQQLPLPLEHPKNLSSRGTKTLSSLTF